MEQPYLNNIAVVIPVAVIYDYSEWYMLVAL